MEKSPVAMAFTRLLAWADARRRLGVRANADTPTDARVAVLFGAEGIGLCRTEHMFFEEQRILAVREMILAETAEGRRAALAQILPMQREDFLGIFREMGERPVTIRLLDPPLHEFLPNEPDALAKTAADLKVPVEKVRERVAQLHEANPMLGHRGCRLGITHPEIYETQVRAIFEAAAAAVKEGLSPNPEVMIPLIGTKAELDSLRVLVDDVARRVIAGDRPDDRVQGRHDDRDPARRAAREGDRAERGLLLLRDQRPDADDVRLLRATTPRRSCPPTSRRASCRRTRSRASTSTASASSSRSRPSAAARRTPKLKVGICGEHGGDPRSIEFFHGAGLDYVSCSPFRVPDRAPGGRAGGARREGRHLLDGVSALALVSSHGRGRSSARPRRPRAPVGEDLDGRPGAAVGGSSRRPRRADRGHRNECRHRKLFGVRRPASSRGAAGASCPDSSTRTRT